MMIGMKNMQKYELKTGEGIRDVVPFKLFNKEEVMEEILKLGFYSDFNDFRKDIEKYPADELLIVNDKEEKYGQNWIICLTVEAKDKFLDQVKAAEAAKQAAEEAERKRVEEEEARIKAEQDAINNAVYQDKPFIARPYASDTIHDTVGEVDGLNVHNTRDLITIHIMRRRRDFGRDKHSKFNDRWAEDVGGEDFRQHKDPHFELQRKQLDIGLQASASWTAPYLAIERAQRREAGVGGAGAGGGGGGGGAGGAGASGTHAAPQRRSSSAGGGGGVDDGGPGHGPPELDAESRLGGQQEEEVRHLVAAATQTAFFRSCNNSVQCSTGDLANAYDTDGGGQAGQGMGQGGGGGSAAGGRSDGLESKGSGGDEAKGSGSGGGGGGGDDGGDGDGSGEGGG
eukprot:g3960.t1